MNKNNEIDYEDVSLVNVGKYIETGFKKSNLYAGGITPKCSEWRDPSPLL